MPIPFEPTDVEAVAITNIGLMFAHFLLLFVLIILMIHYSKRVRYYVIIIVIYLFSLIIGFESLSHPHTPFTPMFEIFFIIFQTSVFIHTALDYIELKNKI